jgi:hypothetical protein
MSNYYSWFQKLEVGSEESIKKSGGNIGKQMVEIGKLTQDEYDQLVNIDPSPNKKYLNWLVKIFLQEKPDVDSLRNYIEEYYTLIGKQRIETKDIYSLHSLDELKNVVDNANSSKSVSLSDLENDYDVIRDDADLFIAVPYTHEASRKLGLSKFQNRSSGDCSWCTTYGNAGHFNSYFFNQNVTFYYILVRNVDMLTQLNSTKYDLRTVAMVVHQNGEVEAYDGKDQVLPSTTLTKFRKVTGI